MSANSSALSSPASSALSSIPSSPLSKLSRSPSVPVDYPSPLSSHDTTEIVQVQVPASQTTPRSTPESSSSVGDYEGAPPAKRRKVVVTKIKESKKTEYLDLRALNNSPDELHHEKQEPKLKKLVEALRNKKKIVVIAGAGISTTAGSKYTPYSSQVICSNFS